MKNLSLLNFKSAVRSKARWLITLIAILTLGVGQMWADPWVKLDVSTGKQGTKTVGDKLNGGSEWWYNYQTNGGWSSDTDIQVLIGTSSSSYSTVNASWYADSGSDKKVHADIGSFTFDKSGIWYAVGKYYASSKTAYTSGTSFTNNSSLSTSMSTSNSPYWEVTPPSVKSFTVSTDGSDILSGTGTSADPYIISYNGSLVLTLSGSKNKTDANSSLQYYTNSTWNSTTSRTISSITSTEKTSVTVKMRCYNSTASLSGTVSSKTIYYKSEASYNVTAAKTPSAGGSVTPTSATAMGTTSGGNITASPSTGYNFSSWAITSGSGYFGESGTATTSATANTKFRPSAATTVTATFTPKTYSITLDGNGGSDGSATATYNSSTLTSVTHCSRASYDLNGYYTATSGGTKVINANGTLVASTSYTNSSSQWTYDDDVELHAQWTYNPVTYSVTYAVGTGYTSYGSLSAKNTSTSAAISSGSSIESGTGITFTATPNTGYVVEGWYTNAACTTGKHDAGSTTYSTTLSGNITVYVKFAEKTWSVAFAAGTGGTVTTPAATPQTVGQITGISIAATPSTGYTFASWSSSTGGSFTSSTSTNSNTFKPTANTTVTASFSEVMSTLSTSCHYDAGNPSYSAPSVSGSATTVGYATTRTITATAAGTGYTFAGWTLTNCTRTDGGSATATSITIRSNGDGAAATVVANYNEDLSSPYTLKGGTNITGDNWTTAHNFTKKTGHSTESVAYCTFTISSTNAGISGSADAWSFKVLKNSTWYGLAADGDSYWWLRSTTANQGLNTSGKNIQICADVAGPYEIKVDYSTPASPTVTVTFPTSYTLTYSIGTTAGNSGSITSSPTTASGSKVLSGNTVTLTAPEAKNGYAWKGWYLANDGSGAQQCSTREYAVTMNANKTLYACYDESTCTAPTALTASSPTATGATLTVTDAEDTNNYEFYVSTSSTAPTSGSSASYTSTSKTKTITNKYAGKKFYAWVRAKCSSTNKSAWTALTGSYFTTSKVSVTHTLTNVTATSGATGANAAGGSTYTAVFAPNSEFSMPTPTVTIGGVTKTAGTDYTWNSETGSLSITQTKITGNIVITLNSVPSAPSSAAISGEWHYFPGETISLTATPTGNNGPTTYQWYKGGKENANKITGATSATYTKASCTYDDMGAYYCKVTCNGSSVWAQSGSSYDLKMLRLYVKTGRNGTDYGNVDFTRVDASTATANISLGYHWDYGFNVADGVGHYFGNTGSMNESNCTGWSMDVDGTDCLMRTTNSATYTFTLNYTNMAVPVISITYPVGDQTSGKTIYFDNSEKNWTNLNYRIGRTDHSQKTAMTKVPGTANLYKVTTSTYNTFSGWHIANNQGDVGSGKSIYNTVNSPAITKATAHEGAAVSQNVTVVPTTSKGYGADVGINDNCEFFNYDILTGMKSQTVSITTPSHGTITVSYTNTAGNPASFNTGSATLAHTVIITPTATPATGYDFGSLTVNGAAHTSGTTYTVTSATTIAATFTPHVYSITYKDQGNVAFSGTHESGYPTTHTYATATTLKTASKTGYRFDGWYTNSSCTGDPVTTLGATDYTADITLYAKWTLAWSVVGSGEISWTVPGTHVIGNIDTDAGNTTGYVDITLSARTTYEIKLYDLSAWEGEHYVGRADEVTTPITYANSGSANALNTYGGYNFFFRTAGAGTYRFTRNFTTGTLTITYPTSYSLTYDGNGSGSGTVPATEYYSSGETVTVASNSGSLARTGYTFDGWNTTANISGTARAAGSTFSMPASNTTLYAKWTQTVTLHDNNGGSHNGSATAIYNHAGPFTPTAPTRTGYTVEGYYKEAGCTNKVMTNTGALVNCSSWVTSGKWVHSGTSTLYAKWTENTYNLTFTHNGHGTIQVGGVTVAAGSTAAVNHVTTKTLVATPDPGYYFTGWTVSGTNSSYVTIASTSSASTTIKATKAGATVTANFSPIWRIACSDDSYSTSSKQITNITTSAGVMTSGYVEVTLAANTNLAFKVFNAQTNVWWGSNTDEMNYANRATAQSFTSGSGSDKPLRTAAAGTYRFTWDVSTSKVTITYPTSYKITIEHGYWNAANDIGARFDTGTGGTVASAVASVSGSLAVTNTNTVTQYVGAGETVTFTHSTANSGWTWYAWGSTFNNSTKTVTQYTNGSGGVTINDGARTMAIASINADKTVYGFFKENVSTITINTANSNYGDLKIGGAASSWGTSVTLGATTTKTIKGEGKNGYMFTTWALSGAATKASGNLTDQQISIKGNGTGGSTGTATATFAPGYVIRGSTYANAEVGGGLAGWDNTTAILTPNLSTGVGTYTATLNRSTRYKFKVYFMEGSGYWRGTSETSDISSGVTYTLPDGGNNITFTAGANGTYTFTYNFSTKALTVLFPTAYTVTYYGNGSTSGSVPTDATPYASGETVNVQGNTGSLAKSDYTLSGWNTTEHITGTTYGSAGGATFTITANTNLYAKWTHAISLDKNGGTGSSTVTATYNSSTLTDWSAPTRTGYTFAGYWTSETSNNGSGTLVINTSGVLQSGVSGYTDASGNWTSSSARTLYAKWTEDTHTVTVASAGNGTVSPTSVSGVGIATASGTITATPNTGYHFDSWTIPDGVTLASGTTSSASITIYATADDKTITANFAANTYEVTLDRNGGTTGSESVTMTYNSNTMIGYTAPTKAGYNFSGYYTSETNDNGSGSRVIKASTLQANVSGYTGADGIWIRTTATTLYAKWTEKYYAITFYNGGHGAVAVNGSTVENGGTASVYHFTERSLVATADPGYDFAGWTKGGTYPERVTIGDGSAASTTITATNKNATVTATWTAHSYTISYDLAGGSVASANPTSYTIESSAITLNNPTRTGYTFAGWTGTGLAEATTTVTIAAGSTGDRSYTATWTANTNTAYTVNHFKQNLDGTYPVSPTETDNLEGTTGASVTPARKSYSGFTAPSGQTVTIAADGSTVVNYNYTRKSYTLTWALAGGTVSVAGTGAAVGATGSPSSSVKYGATITKPTVVRENYAFNGWSATPPATMPASNKTYTAQWVEAVASVAAEGEATTYYATVAAAITAANALTNPTVTMLQDATTTQREITAAMTIDLNGKTVSSTATTNKNGVFKINASGQTVTITDGGSGGKIDHTADIAGSVYGVYVIAGTLNMDGGTIYAKNTNATVADANLAYGIASAASTTVTISNGTVEAECPDNTYAYGIYAAGNLTMTGGTVNASGTDYVRGIYLRAASATPLTASLTNATVTSTASATYSAAVYTYSYATLTINSGTYTATGTGNVYAVSERSTATNTVYIEGGKFSGTTKDLYKGDAATASISGGYYVSQTTVKDNLAANHHVFPVSLTEGGITYNYEVAEGYTLTWTTDGDALTGDYTKGTTKVGTTIVTPNTPTKTNYVFNGWSPDVAATMPAANTTYTATWTEAVAKVQVGAGTPSYYTTVSAAIGAANALTNPTVTILKTTTTTEVSITAAMTIDLNGKTVSSTAASASSVFKINASGKTVTITDGLTGGTINHTASYAGGYLYGVWLYAGSLSITGGTIHAENTGSNRAYGIYTSNSATSITMSSGTIEAVSASPYGIYASNTCNLTMTGGTITSTGSGSRGIYVQGTTSLTNATITASGTGNTLALFAKKGTMTISSGTYRGTWSIYIPNESTAGSVIVNGGKFSGTDKEINKVGSYGSVALSGGYYVHDTDLTGFCTANHHVFGISLTEGGITYNHEVATGYTLTWNLAGGTVTTAGTMAPVDATGSPSGVVKVGTTLIAPVVTKAGYTFSAWSPAVAATMPSSDTEYTATWTTAALRFTMAGNWNTPSNWTPACVPTAEHDVIIQKPCSVDIANAAAKSVVIYNNGSDMTGSLNIGATKGLNVTGTIQKTTNGSTYGPTSGYDLVLESSASGNASLIFNNSNGCQAWVLMYSKGNHDGSKWNWQYVGTPFTGTIANPNYAGSYLYKWKDATSTETFGWTNVTNENAIEPWVGYCLTQPSPVTLEMEGTLVATDGLGDERTRSFNTGVVAGTPKVLANSWTAPIQIKQMTAADFSNVQQTIYLFNTGNAEAGKPGTEGTEAGTYITVSINASPYTGDSVISSMQGFYVKKANAEPSASITLNYGKHVRPSGNNAIGQGPMKAPKQDELKPQWMKIVAQGSRYASKLYLFAREDFTYGFDDGWDGENINSAGASALMYSPREDGTKDAISAIPEFEGAVVGFEAGEDSEYTFSFTYEGDEEWYLNDLHTWNSTRISAENTYTFGTTDNDDIRFVISAQPLEKMPEGIDDTNAEGARARKLLIRDKLYIILNGRIYDGTGKIVMDK